MTEAEKAFEIAEGLIEEARESGAETLNFDREETQALQRLPESIGALDALRIFDCSNTQISDLSPVSGLVNLRELWLDNTQVSDLGALSGLVNLTGLSLDNTQVSDLGALSGLVNLTGLSLDNTQVSDLGALSGLVNLTGLGLNDTQVSDLRPLQSLEKLADDPDYLGLTFKSCAAARSDPRIAEISDIEDAEQRAQTLFAYLEDWEPLGAQKPDPLFQIDSKDDRLEVAASTPTEAERDERLKQVLHERLKQKAKALARQAGNQFFRLSARARALEVQVEQELADLDLLMLHLAIDDIRDLEALGREDADGDAFPPEVMIALGDVLRLGPGLTLGHPDVDVLVERANRRRGAPPVPEAELAAQDAMSEALVGDEAAIGDRLRALEEAVAGSGSAEDREVQKGANRSVLWRIGVHGINTGGDVTKNVAITLLSAPIVAWVNANLPTLGAAAQTYGPAFFDWFVMSVGQVPQFSGLLDKLPRRTKKD